MMGKDCERIIAGINRIQTELQEMVLTMMRISRGPIEMGRFTVICSEGSKEDFELKEKEIDLPDDLMSSVMAAKKDLDDDFDKMAILKKKLYTSTTSFNNCNGSPWTEMNQLKEKIELLDKQFSGLKFKSELLVLMSLVSSVIGIAIDTKQSMIMYHDYIQRGYDAVFNGKTPSITFKKDKTTNSIGNLNQPYAENVNIEPESLDPY